ncbi:MAG: hypothetical protein JRJ39_00415 [Deltaproteobacteria bacterium]|nr:hypothetical protein [Deltaproteobacteria bacterium]MBW1845571.1 hypothetical protein [Deltaproteobacteria bacterium]MBW2032000.1 hypothetical protein [Deltaproteobacteria bacterium]MBW2180960.1 hypothetical protein [Deltaproteobacteria bacterium]
MSKEGGYILLARALDNSDIMNKPPHFREIWLWFLRNAVWKDCVRKGLKLKRGELLTSYNEILDDLAWDVGNRSERYKKHHVDRAFRFFKEADMVTTAKTTRGLKVTILKYNEYQRSESYEADSEDDYEADTVGVVPFIRNIKKKYLEIKLPKNFPLNQFIEYEIARMNGKKDGRKKWNDKNRQSAIKTFLSLAEFIDEIKVDGYTGLTHILEMATENKWRGFEYFKKSMRGIREKRKQASIQYKKDKDSMARPQPPAFNPKMLE